MTYQQAARIILATRLKYLLEEESGIDDFPLIANSVIDPIIKQILIL